MRFPPYTDGKIIIGYGINPPPHCTPLMLVRHSILIENLGETLEAVLTPVIQRAVIYRGRKMYIKLGDSEVEFHPDFRSVLLSDF